jgi:hypothetical protein
LGVFFFQILVDDGGLVNNFPVVYQHRDFAIGIEFQQFFRLVFQIAFNEIIRDTLFGQDKPCPVGVGSRTVGQQFHIDHLL